ncbi:serine threonine-protein kinase nek7 [Chrysochromulina tobinii]|uniref:non-specific serine/threonine protein kinase n=1 Tax=Chrysochromulina tobinii TaxID=1460289 RepID=A0A0M0JII1_9EUKA|nr:serine threonine-protein kinase nek7 [Chrysochromulina tobinii]|eukprot:KOO26295.1 serine threonine-protein kinase nek7 [Chrysochromulina sp. CCMP291]
MGGDAGRYERVSLLGKGATSTVYRARRLSDGRHFAYKLVKLTGFSEVQRAEILNEVECMTRLHHPNVVSYEESFVHSDHLHIVMELLSGGDLAREVESRSSGPNGERPPAYLDEEVIWSILVQVCEGLHHMHSVRVLHRDIKAENIYSDGRGAVKIGDLGLGRLLSTQSTHARTGVGTPLYFSPEMCEERPYNAKSDVWALGCLVYELCSLQPPFLAANQLALARKIMTATPASLPSHYSRELQFLVMKMLEKDTQRRPTAAQILNYSPVRSRIPSVHARCPQLNHARDDARDSLIELAAEEENVDESALSALVTPPRSLNAPPAAEPVIAEVIAEVAAEVAEIVRDRNEIGRDHHEIAQPAAEVAEAAAARVAAAHAEAAQSTCMQGYPPPTEYAAARALERAMLEAVDATAAEMNLAGMPMRTPAPRSERAVEPRHVTPPPASPGGWSCASGAGGGGVDSMSSTPRPGSATRPIFTPQLFPTPPRPTAHSQPQQPSPLAPNAAPNAAPSGTTIPSCAASIYRRASHRHSALQMETKLREAAQDEAAGLRERVAILEGRLARSERERRQEDAAHRTAVEALRVARVDLLRQLQAQSSQLAQLTSERLAFEHLVPTLEVRLEETLDSVAELSKALSKALERAWAR